MGSLRYALTFLLAASFASSAASAQTSSACLIQPSIAQSALTAEGSVPFHLRAVITDKDDPEHPTSVEMFWVVADKWRREIKGPEFSQTLVVNGPRVFEQHSDEYFPLVIRALVTAMVDPGPLTPALRPDPLRSNCVSYPSGVVCWDGLMPNGKTRPLCMQALTGTWNLWPMGHRLDFSDYRDFNGRRVARLLGLGLESGSYYRAKVTELSALEQPDAGLFKVGKADGGAQIRVLMLPEPELRARLEHTHEIIWPQVLDGHTTGTASYYVSVDRLGKVRETVVVQSDNERANDSARAQISRWRFKPSKGPQQSFLQRLKDFFRGGDKAAVQTEGALNFSLNTRAFGPASILTDAEARKLASNTVEPDFPAGAPSGATVSTMVAVDADGRVIEMIAGDGPPGLSLYCMKAIAKWHFSPVRHDGQSLPYRAQIDFKVR